MSVYRPPIQFVCPLAEWWHIINQLIDYFDSRNIDQCRERRVVFGQKTSQVVRFRAEWLIIHQFDKSRIAKVWRVDREGGAAQH